METYVGLHTCHWRALKDNYMQEVMSMIQQFIKLLYDFLWFTLDLMLFYATCPFSTIFYELHDSMPLWKCWQKPRKSSKMLWYNQYLNFLYWQAANISLFGKSWVQTFQTVDWKFKIWTNLTDKCNSCLCLPGNERCLFSFSVFSGKDVDQRLWYIFVAHYPLCHIYTLKVLENNQASSLLTIMVLI